MKSTGGRQKIVLQLQKSEVTFLFFLPNLTSYSTTLRVISSGGGLGLNGFEEVCRPEEV